MNRRLSLHIKALCASVSTLSRLSQFITGLKRARVLPTCSFWRSDRPATCKLLVLGSIVLGLETNLKIVGKSAYDDYESLSEWKFEYCFLCFILLLVEKMFR